MLVLKSIYKSVKLVRVSHECSPRMVISLVFRRWFLHVRDNMLIGRVELYTPLSRAGARRDSCYQNADPSVLDIFQGTHKDGVGGGQYLIREQIDDNSTVDPLARC
ncbi:hypothetical protein BO226_24920 (plasmid) [Rhodococcus sp. 2G]|nr:hypothetical protein BO226_24920 [Rhodococcus sp. 2G]